MPVWAQQAARLLDEVGVVRWGELSGDRACRRRLGHCLSRGRRTCCTRRMAEMAELAGERFLAAPWRPLLGIPGYPRACVAGLCALVVAGLGAE